MVPHFKELVLSKLPEASCCRLLVSNVDPILRGAQEIGLPSVTFWTTSASSFMAKHSRRIDIWLQPLLKTK